MAAFFPCILAPPKEGPGMFLIHPVTSYTSISPRLGENFALKSGVESQQCHLATKKKTSHETELQAGPKTPVINGVVILVISRVITPVIHLESPIYGVIPPFITSRGPPCKDKILILGRI